MVANNPNVKSIVLFNESKSFKDSLWDYDWNFRHLDLILKGLQAEDPTKDFYMFQGPPFVLEKKEKRNEGNDGGEAEKCPKTETCPTLVIIKVPRGETPPEFVLKSDPEMLTEDVIPFEDFGVTWKFFSPRQYDNRVFALKQIHGKLSAVDLKVTKLWTLKGEALNREDNGDLKLTKAVFDFKKSDGETLRGCYDKSLSQCTHICLMNNMVMKDEHGESIPDEDGDVQVDMEELGRLKNNTSMAFKEGRCEREKQITMLREKNPTFDTLSAVKVFPQNEAVCDHFLMTARAYKAKLSMNDFFMPAKLEESAQTSPFRKVGYINEWYETAEKVVPDPDKILTEVLAEVLDAEP